MLKKLYFHQDKTHKYVFDITGTIKVDKPGFTKWVIEVDPDNEVDTWVVVATTDDCAFDIVEDETLVVCKLQPVEKTDDPDIWTVNIEKEDFTVLTIEGEITWTKYGDLKVKTGDSHVNYLSSNLREFDVDDVSQVITARYKQ
jgi:hypothetical protein